MTSVSVKAVEASCAEKLDKIFQKKDSLLEYNPGRCLLPTLFRDVAQKVLDAEVRDDDLWFISFPRTGSTWCMEMVWLIRHDLDFKTAQEQLLQIRNPLIELSGIFEAEWCRAFLKTDSVNFIEYVNNLPSPRIIRSHLPWCLLPTQLSKIKPKLIYIFRDPKDVCVSLYHYLQLLHSLSTTFEEFAELFLAGQVPYGSYFDHVAGYWNFRNEENFLFLTYEEMKRDLRKTAHKVADFLGKQVPEAEMDRLMEHLNFQKMKQNPTCNLDVIVRAVGAPEGNFMRKGQTGDWKNYFSDQMAERFDEAFRRSVPVDWKEKIRSVCTYKTETKQSTSDSSALKMSYEVKKLSGRLADMLDRSFGAKDSLLEFGSSGCLLPIWHEHFARRIIEGEVREDDVWLISYPKTGSTWVQEMVWLIGNNLDFGKASSTIQQIRAPSIELSTTMAEYYLNDGLLSKTVGDSVNYVANLPSPRYIKAHLPLDLLPKQLEKVKPKTIYVARNPKDVCVSYYHHNKVFYRMDATFEDFCEMFIHGYVPMGNIFNHYLQYWAKRNDHNFMFLKYEDIKADVRGTLRKIADFMEQPLEEKDYDALCDFLSVEKMRENQGCNFEPIVGRRNYEKNGTRFVRKGIVGDWKNHMSEEMSKRFDAWIEEKTRGTGLTFS